MGILIRQFEYAKYRGISRQRVYQLKKEGRIVMVGRLVDVDASDRLIDATESGLPQHQARKEREVLLKSIKAHKDWMAQNSHDEKDIQTRESVANAIHTCRVNVREEISNKSPDEKDQHSATDSASAAQTGDTLERVGLDLKIAQKRKAEADAEKAEMEAGAMRKELVPIDDVMSAVNDVFTVLRVSVGAIPDKYSAQLAAEPDEARVHSLLGAEIDAVLTHAANMVDEGFA